MAILVSGPDDRMVLSCAGGAPAGFAAAAAEVAVSSGRSNRLRPSLAASQRPLRRGAHIEGPAAFEVRKGPTCRSTPRLPPRRPPLTAAILDPIKAAGQGPNCVKQAQGRPPDPNAFRTPPPASIGAWSRKTGGRAGEMRLLRAGVHEMLDPKRGRQLKAGLHPGPAQPARRAIKVLLHP
jgi:hypothetical protein